MTDEAYLRKEKIARKMEFAHGNVESGRWGFVRYVDHMGSDTSVVQAARVSYGNGTKGNSSDEALLYRLMRSGHTSPFEQIEIKFHIGCPIFTARQLFRHRTASANEYSGRYSEIPEEYWAPFPEDIRTQHKTEKQVSEGLNSNAEDIAKLLNGSCYTAQEDYKALLSMGCPREQARAVLPQGQMTQFYWKMDGHNLLHLIGLREDSHAQKEIQDLAAAMRKFFQAVFPLTWAAYDKAIRQGRKLTGPQWEAVKRLISREYALTEIREGIAASGMVKTGPLDITTEGLELLEALGYGS